MADPTPDDETEADPEAELDGAGEDAPEADETEEGAAAAKVKAPADPKADVAARRAATKARMDADKGKAPSTATADDPTGAKARRRSKAAESVGKASATDPTGAKARREAATTKKVPRPSKRTGGAVDPKTARTTAARSGNPKKAADAASESSRYTAPIPRSQLESPTWVPVIMFGLLAMGMIVIFMTYVLWEGRPLALGVGLACILGGILAATQYR